MFKTALFDLDGTLFDTEGQYSVFWGAMGRKYHPEIPHFDEIIKGTTLKQILERYFPDPAVQEPLIKGLDEWEAQMHYEFIPGALDFLHDLREHGVNCAVVTSSNQPKMDSVRRQMPEFDSLFDRVLTAEMFAASKPDPDCYLLGARVFGSEISECVVFEDAFTGLQAGMSAGMLTIGLATYNKPEAIADKCHHVMLDFQGLTYDKVNAWLHDLTSKTCF
ncbi:MAG: HAD family hydrolase [Bacteroidales bacterium]|nr:HAD family hydrolase [Candidatus Liminaster caballi]